MIKYNLSFIAILFLSDSVFAATTFLGKVVAATTGIENSILAAERTLNEQKLIDITASLILQTKLQDNVFIIKKESTLDGINKDSNQ